MTLGYHINQHTNQMIQVENEGDEYIIKRLVEESIFSSEEKLTEYILKQINVSTSVENIKHKLLPYFTLEVTNEIHTSSGSTNGSKFLTDIMEISCVMTAPLRYKKKTLLKYTSGPTFKYYIECVVCCKSVITVRSLVNLELTPSISLT